MAMIQTQLYDALVAMDLYYDTALAANAWANAFSFYFEDAESNSVDVESTALVTAEASMAGALFLGFGLENDPKAIADAITAFWNAIIPATAWPTVTVITAPPGLGTLESTLTAVWNSNIASRVTKQQAYTAIAGAIHAANSGGAATWPTPGPGIQPIT